MAAKPGDKQPRGYDPKKLLANENTIFGDYYPPVGQQNIYGILGDRAGRIPRRSLPYIETAIPNDYALSDFLPVRQQIQPIGEVARYVPPEQTLMDRFPLYRRPPLGEGTPGSLNSFFGDVNNLRGVPQWARNTWENQLRLPNYEDVIRRFGITYRDAPVAPGQGGPLAALADQLKPFRLSPTEATAAVERVPIQPLVQDMAAAGRSISPLGIIPGAVGAVAAPYVINQLPVSGQAKNVLTGAAEGGSLGSMGFAFGPQVGIPATALGTLLGGGAALLGL